MYNVNKLFSTFFRHVHVSSPSTAQIMGLMTFNLLDRILKKFELDKYFITAGKSILYLVNLQSLVAKYRKTRKI